VTGASERPPGERYLFGPFEFRPVERLLLREGAPVALGSRATDILIRLLHHRGHWVTHADLLAYVWHGVNVAPTALRVHVSALRKVLAQGDPGARYVSTLAGRGYRFAAPVLQETSGDPAGSWSEARALLAAPDPLRRVVGRERVLGELERTIAAERLVTLVGPGGIGKTTVAVAIARRLSPAFNGDVAFVDLAIQKGSQDIAGAVATAVGMGKVEGVRVADVATQLRSRRLLLILDCCERLISGAAELAEAVCRTAPECHVLATSREPLRALGERVYRLAALETPPPSDTLSFEQVSSYPAAQLFIERATSAGGKIQSRAGDALLVADICRRLDGVPLAIELAAGRVDGFGLAMTHALLDSRLRLSWPGRRTAPPRHVTLGATLDWSYDLLSPEEARLLRALSAFVGAFPLEGCEAVADDSLRSEAPSVLAALVAKSLVSTDHERAPLQYRLLDTTQHYARLKLEAAGELPETAARHARWTIDELGHQEYMPGAREPPEWRDYFDNLIQNAHSALDWSFSEGGDESFTVPLTLACAPVWTHLGRTTEGRRRIEAALVIAERDTREEMLLNRWLGLALLDVAPYDMDRAEVAGRRALEIASALDDPESTLRARLLLWNTAILTRPNIPNACERALLYRDFAWQRGSPADQVSAEHMVAVSELVAGNLGVARAAIDRALKFNPPWNSGLSNTLLSLLWLGGTPDTATALAHENLERAKTTGFHAFHAAALADSCGGLAMYLGDLIGAEHFADMIDDCVTRGAWSSYRTWAQVLRATITARRGDAGPGRSFLSAELPPECGHPRFASVLTELAWRLGAAGAAEIAREFADQLLHRIEATGELWIWSEVQRVRGELSPDASEAESLFEAALAVAQQQGARAWALRAATSLARRRRSAAEELLRPLLASFMEGARTQDHLEAQAVLREPGGGETSAF